MDFGTLTTIVEGKGIAAATEVKDSDLSTAMASHEPRGATQAPVGNPMRAIIATRYERGV